MTDILLGNDGDLLLDGGDIVVGDSLVQHQRELILIDAGQLVFAPTVGVGAERYLLDNDLDAFRAACKVALQRDGLPDVIDPYSLIIYRNV